MKIKKRFFACAVLALTLSLIMQNTLAYFTAASTARNVITSGAIDITLIEKTASGEPWADVNGIMPGETVSKIVAVMNHDMPAYVRVQCRIGVQDAQGSALEPGELLRLDLDMQNWTYLDGWWYYNHLLDTDETTLPLFTKVEFSADAEKRYANCDMTIDVLAQATQAANNGTDVFTAAGWPEA